MENSRNLILAIILSVVILITFDLYTTYKKSNSPVQPGATTEQDAGAGPQSVPQGAPQSAAAPGAIPGSAPGSPPAAGVATQTVKGRANVLAEQPRVKIETSKLSGSIVLRGGRIDDLTLTTYRTEMDAASPPIVLLSPQGSEKAYFADFGWVAGAGETVPGPDTVWTANRKTLAPAQPVTLRWDNGAGLTFERIYAVDENYMFTIKQRVTNAGQKAASLFAYGLVSRHETPQVTGFFILHEGLLGVFDEKLKEVDYDEIKKDGTIKQASTGGWIGITDKYWMTALVPNQKTKTSSRFVYSKDGGTDKFQVDYLSGQTVVAAGGQAEVSNNLFTGAKEIKVIDAYEENLKITRFDLAIDFGWFYFLTKPIFYMLIEINDYVGNFGVAILLLTVIIKLIFFPLANKSYRSMSKMKKIQPEMVKMRERFGDDKARLNQEMMALYKKEKVNPASGCLPVIVQIPVFFALYKVLFVTIEMRQAPFFGWIQDLSAPDPTVAFELFGLIEWGAANYLPDFLLIGVWPLIMGITMFLQQKLNPQPADPMQAKMFMFLPIIFTFLLARFPAGLVIYWAWNNLLSIIQQKVIMVRMGVK